eukprot:TRINITY_DN16071_c0_g1::TRINITY_DN16071_c0_g1_i1::g.13805::m.13805 TRINITY_DN16071_c0_g1::TRINITY_DN16071_c0_g1_i1::g.13805  ORF type:complete len:349 (-),score=53.60,sp/Q54MB9/ZNTC_DICDI/41.21/5e-28,sp/Q54MB9/ZNTC_DICDI/32.23/3e-11,Zip/PF02535.17/9.8e-42 TRINITY_DN16071_c0_g1_i1:955-1962(-)
MVSVTEDHALFSGKIILLCTLGFWTTFCSFTPWFLRHFFTRDSLSSINICVAASAGVIIGAYMLHIVPEANECFTEYFAEKYPNGELIEYPLAQLLSLSVFTLLVIIDRAIVANGMTLQSHNHSHGGSSSEHAHNHNHVADSLNDLAKHNDRCHISSEPEKALPFDTKAVVLQEVDPKKTAIEHREAILRAYVFFMALSIHGFFDGLSVGSETERAGFLSTAIGVSVHKGFDGLAVGVPIFFARLSRLHTWSIIVFTAFMTPLGIGVGMAAIHSVTGLDAVLAQGILQGLSGGSFIFIGLYEMLPASLHDNQYTTAKIIAFILGWAALCILAIWT